MIWVVQQATTSEYEANVQRVARTSVDSFRPEIDDSLCEAQKPWHHTNALYDISSRIRPMVPGLEREQVANRRNAAHAKHQMSETGKVQ